MPSPSYASRAAPTTGRARDRHDHPRTRAPAGRHAGRLPGRPRPRARRGAQGPRPVRRRAHLPGDRAGGRHPDAARGSRRPGAAGGDVPRHRGGGGRLLRAHLGAVGGLVSSTAITISMAERSHAGAARPAAASAAVLASTIMCVRMAVLAGVVDAGILPRLLPILAVMAAAGGAAAWLMGRGQAGRTAVADGSLTNPFSLKAALTFAAVYTLVLLGVRAAQEHLGASGLYLASALSAIVSVDAPTVALAHLGGGTSGWSAPAAAIGVVAITNTLVKFGIAIAYGAGSFRSRVATALGVMSVLGGLTGLAVLGRF